jgi:hypothetical protein
MALRSSNFSKSSELCSAARVMTMRLPAKDDAAPDGAGRDDAEGSATLATHFFEDVLRACIDEKLGHAPAQGSGLIGRSRSALLDVL